MKGITETELLQMKTYNLKQIFAFGVGDLWASEIWFIS